MSAGQCVAARVVCGVKVLKYRKRFGGQTPAIAFDALAKLGDDVVEHIVQVQETARSPDREACASARAVSARTMTPLAPALVSRRHRGWRGKRTGQEMDMHVAVEREPAVCLVSAPPWVRGRHACRPRTLATGVTGHRKAGSKATMSSQCARHRTDAQFAIGSGGTACHQRQHQRQQRARRAHGVVSSGSQSSSRSSVQNVCGRQIRKSEQGHQ